MDNKPTPINVIEIRACKNGFVVAVFYSDQCSDGPIARGYECHAIESHDPDKLGGKIAEIARGLALSTNVFIPPARKLP